MRGKLAFVLLLATPSVAHAGWWRPINAGNVETLRADIAAQAAKEGLEAGLADIYIQTMLGSISNDTGCPGVDVDFLNNTDRTFWNVELKIEQHLGAQQTQNTVHLPYIPAHSEVRYSVSCLQDSTYSYSYGGGADIMLGHTITGAEDLDLATLEAMQRLTVDFSLSGSGIIDGGSGGQSVLEAAFAYADTPELAATLVQAAMQDTDASAVLLAAVRAHPESLVAEAAAARIKKLKAKEAAPFIDALITTTDADGYADALEPVIKAQCKDKRRSVELWRRAISADGVPGYTTRSTILRLCEPSAKDVQLLVDDLADDPARLAEAIDGFEKKMFDPTFARVVSKVRDALPHLMRVTSNPARFTAAAEALRPDELAAAVPIVARAPASDLSARKAAWVAVSFAAVKASDPGAVDGIVAAIFREVAAGTLSPEMVAQAERLRLDAPKAAEAAMVEVIDERAYVLLAGKVAEAGADLLAFDQLSAAALTRCTDDLPSLRVCAESIRDAQGGALIEVGREGGWQPGFVDSANALLQSGVATADAINAAQALGAIGFDLTPTITNLCTQAQAAERAHRSTSEMLGAIATLDADNSCAATIRTAASSRERKDFIFSILGLFAIALPVPAVAVALKRRYKKLLDEAPKDKAPTEAAALTPAARLGGVDRVVQNGLAEARRTIAKDSAPAARALEQIATVEPALAARARLAAQEALRTGDVSSAVVKLDGLAVYVVAFPGLHDQPQAIRRHLSSGWADHAESMRKTVAASGGAGSLLSLLVFVAPDASEAVFLVGFTDGRTPLSPAALVDARAKGVTDFRHGSPL